MKFRKKPVIIEAVQWFRKGDSPDVISDCPELEHLNVKHCEHCGGNASDHGWCPTLEGGHIVCPGDMIITGVKGEHYPCKPNIFVLTYEPANED